MVSIKNKIWSQRIRHISQVELNLDLRKIEKVSSLFRVRVIFKSDF